MEHATSPSHIVQEMPQDGAQDQPVATLQPAVNITPEQTAAPVDLLPLDHTERKAVVEPSDEQTDHVIHSVECPEEIDSSIAPPPILCAACHLAINERYLLQAMDHYWHEDCLKCSCCDCRLGEVGASLYTKANLLLCKRDYLRLFGASGACTICKMTIPAFEMVMKVKANVYHLECFSCQQCRQRFCVGDKFYLCENRILCEYDFEEQNLITSIQRGYNTLSHMRKQTETLSDISSGYGSPSPGTM